MNLKSKGVFKKFAVMFSLLLVVTAIFVPFETVNAGPLTDWISFDIFGSFAEFVARAAADESNSFFNVIYWFAYRIISLGLYVTTILVYFGSWLVDVFLDEKIYASVLNMNDSTSAVAIGWRTVRDACNTFFILFLLIIAFSTILRIQAYSAKSLLPKLIISLFLINFSAVIAMMVIDLGQVFMFEIKTWMGAGGFSGAGSPLTTIVDYFYNEYGWHRPSPSGVYTMSDVVGVSFAVAYSAILGLLYIMLALFLMVRIIVFVILIIISPFAFFSIILPGMRTYTSQWWQSLVSHTIFGPVFLFFIFLASKMAQSMQTFNSTVPEPTDMEPLSFIVAKLIPHIVAIGMLMAAIPVTQKLGVAGANKFIGGAAGIGKIGIGAVAGAKLLGGGAKKVGGGVASRNNFVGRNVDKVKGKYYEGLEKYTLGLGRGAAMKGRASIEKKKEEKMKKLEVDFGDLKSIDLNVLEKKAKGKLGTTDDKALWLKAAAARGELGKHEKTAKEFMTGAERSLNKKEVNEITDKNLVLATKTSEAQKSGKTDEEIMTEKMNDIVENGEAHKVQGLGNSAMATKVWHDGQDSEQRKNSMNRMNEKQRSELAEGYTLNTIQNEGEYTKLRSSAASRDPVIGPAAREKMEKDSDFRTKAVEAGKGLGEAFTIGSITATDEIEKAFDKFNHKTIAKLTSDDVDDHGYSSTDDQIRGLNKAGEYKTVEKIIKSKENRMRHLGSGQEYDDLEAQVNKWRNNPTSSSGGGGSSPIAHSEPKSRQPVSGGGSVDSSATNYQRTKDKLNELAEGGDFDQGVGISGKLGMSAPKEKNGKLLIGSKTIDNLHEAFEADKEFAEGGFTDIVKHEEQHNKAFALQGSQAMERKLKEYSEQEGVSTEDIENKRVELEKKYYEGPGQTEQTKKLAKEDLKEYIKENKGASAEDIRKKSDELHEKYTDYRGYEMQTEMQRVNKGFENKEQFIKDEARMHVMTDVAYEGMDKMGEIEYGSENSGLHRTHSAFIKDDVRDEITKEMEEMRQDLVAKHEARKDGEAGDDETTVESGDNGKSGTETEKPDKKGKVKKAVDSYKEYAKKTSPGNVKKKVIDPIARGMDKASVPVGKAEIAALKVARFYPPARTVSTAAIPILEKGVKIAEEKVANPKLTNKDIRKRELQKLKNIIKPVALENADGVVEVAGDRTSKALNEAAENASGKTKIALKVASAVTGSAKVQEAASGKIKNKLDDQEEWPAVEKTNTKTTRRPKPKSAPKQQTTEEKEETKPVAKPKTVATKKDMGSAPVVETKITSKVNVGGDMSKQIENALKNISSEMTQNINVGFDSSQGITGLDLKELVDTKEIAKLVNEGVNVKSVKDSLEKVQDSFKEFERNNRGNANTTIFGAGISAAQTALKEAQNREDHEEQAVGLATITNVLGEIERGMKKQGKVDRKEEE